MVKKVEATEVANENLVNEKQEIKRPLGVDAPTWAERYIALELRIMALEVKVAQHHKHHFGTEY